MVARTNSGESKVVDSIKSLIVALFCVAMLTITGQDVAEGAPATSGDSKGSGIQPGPQQPSDFSGFQEIPLKLGGRFQTDILHTVARIENMPEYQTTVVYLGELPLLSVLTSAETSGLERASRIATDLNRLSLEHVPAETIQIEYDGELYSITAGEDVLLTIDKEISLSRTERPSDAAIALQVANRLRRTLGNAADLDDVPTALERLGKSVTKTTLKLSTTVNGVFQGIASWYGAAFANRKTASGALFLPENMTAAHRALPFGTVLRVTNLTNGKQVTVKVSDRGPFIPGRVLDLSRGAARAIGMMSLGVAQVKVEVLKLK